MNKIIYRNSFRKYVSVILLVIFLLNTNSCKKDTSALNAKNDVFYANQLTAQSKVSASDVNGWFTKYQQLKPAAELLAQAQQAVINGSSVVRVPMGTNSAFYFIKVDGVLQVYIYKWLNQSPGTMQFTGRIVSYSFQDNEVRELDYKAGQLTQVQNLAHILPNISPDGIKPNSVTLGYIWGAFTCWLGGGSWVYVASEIKATDFDSPKRVDSTQYDYYECNHGSTTTGDNSNWNTTNWGLDWLNTGASHFVASADYGGGLYWIQPPSSPCGGIQQESTDYPVPLSSKPKVQSTTDKTTASTGDCGNGNTVFIPITLIDAPRTSIDPNSVLNLETSFEPMNLDTDPDLSFWDDNSVSFQRQTLPSYNDMYANYPKNSDGTEIPAQQVAASIGGEVAALYVQNGYANACALRMSKALNYSGINIPHIQDYTFLGGDGKYYFLSAAKLSNFLRQTFGAPDISMDQTQGGQYGVNFGPALNGLKGIFVMIPNDPTKTGYNASGHVSIFTNTTCVGGVYHTPYNVPGGVKHLYLWKFK